MDVIASDKQAVVLDVKNIAAVVHGCIRDTDPKAKKNAKTPKDFPYYTEFDERAFSFLIMPKPMVNGLSEPIEVRERKMKI